MKSATRRATSVGVGARDTQSRKPYATREAVVPPAGASPVMRRASALAASNDAGSFSSVSAWSGVFVRTRRTVQNSRLGASNVAKVGYVQTRRQNV